ncbi:hypothetical protein ABB02_00275 [Clostridiaceae bacterium JG1575]|nr:hypothetical protein ABB02_00275 [Clostridiaceae bacterium JG1575]
MDGFLHCFEGGDVLKKYLPHLVIAATGIAALSVYEVVQNQALHLVIRELYLKDLDPSLDRLRIAQITDLHGARYGRHNSRLAAMITAAQPDVLCMTGDMVHHIRDEGTSFLELITRLDRDLPKLYVTGNHESQKESKTLQGREETRLFERLDHLGVVRLAHDSWQMPGRPIRFAGLADRRGIYEDIHLEEESFEPFRELPLPDPEQFNVALCHRPYYFRSIASYGYDLMLSGHVHGGVLRLPGLGGVLSPTWHFFPELDKGLFSYKGSHLYVSSGLGLSKPLPRLGNRPEVVLLILRSGEAPWDMPMKVRALIKEL